MIKHKRNWQLQRLIQHDHGGSLPGVLVAVAIGAILMGLFLSHVSTRMLSLGAVEETLEEQYAVDSGAEFATWTLLNDTAFQDSVDAAYPDPVSVTPAITVNGLSPNISAAAVNKRGWTTLALTPDSVNKVGDLAYSSGMIYAMEGQGANISLWQYNINTDNWSTISSGPSKTNISDGASLVYRAGDAFYAILGNKSDEFWSYEPGNGWDKKRNPPGEFGKGSDMVVVGADIYALQGGKNNCPGNTDCDGFWKYSTAADTWTTLSSTDSDVGSGGSLAFPGGNYIYALAGGGSSTFWVYEISIGNWSSLPPITGNVNEGGSLAFTGNNTLHALLGGDSTEIRSYDIASSTWQSGEAADLGIGQGGSIAWDHDEYLYVLRGNNSRDFWRYLAAPPKYDLTAQAGATTLQSRILLNRPQAEILWWDWQ